MPCRPDPVLFALACTKSRSQLARQVRFLKEENEILRLRIRGRITLTHEERARLIRFGLPLGDSLKQLISVVRHATFKRWLRSSPPPRSKKPGPPRKPEDIRKLVIEIAERCGFGYGRILGELAKLGITDISKSTIRRILIEAGLGPAPKKHRLTWDQYLKAHADTLWACDFFTKKVWTKRGPKIAHVLVFIHVASRRVIASCATARPHHECSACQAQIILDEVEELGMEQPKILIRDGDGKFGARFNEVLSESGCKPKRIPRGIPVMNAFAERFVRSVKTKCLDHFVCFSENHLDHLIEEYLEHYHQDRPHQGIGNRTIEPRHPPPKEGKIVLKSRLGGVLKSYERRAA